MMKMKMTAERQGQIHRRTNPPDWILGLFRELGFPQVPSDEPVG